MAMKYAYHDIGTECTAEQWAAQYSTADPVVGGQYVINKGCWMETNIKIIHATRDGRYLIGQAYGIKYCREVHDVFVFHATGAFKGFRVNDTVRTGYRLQNKE